MVKIAIIGAGLAGLTLARRLQDIAQVTVFEKSRGLGGRLSTRRAEPFAFDHGAQYFTAKTDAFNDFLKPMIASNVVQAWDARVVDIRDGQVMNQRQWDATCPHYVGSPGMSAIGRYLADGLDVRRQTHIQSVVADERGWALTDTDGEELGVFDWVISTAPVAQTAALLPPSFAAMSALPDLQMQGCFAVMLGFDQALPLDFDVARVVDTKIGWIAVNSSKPGRPDACRLVIHANNAWSQAHLDAPRDTVMTELCDAASDLLGLSLATAQHRAIHAWRYANVDQPRTVRYLLDTDNQLAAAGDWCLEGRVESAFSSAMALADDLRKRLVH
jgi:predicted NAD/FAD-dependent oxidoreductase